VIFKGFDNISPSRAQEVIETKGPTALQLGAAPTFSQLAVNRDEKRLVKLYEEYGFFDATVTAEVKRLPESRTAIVTFEAHEKDPTNIQEIQLTFPDPVARQQWEKKLLQAISLKPGQRFILSDYQDAKDKLGMTLSDEGHPQNQVQGQVRVYKEQRRAVILFKVSPGPLVLFGLTTVVGNQRVAEKYILREAAYVRGQPFSLKALNDTQRALLDTGFFVSATPEPLYHETKDDQVPIKILVQERDPHSIRLGLGWGNEDSFRVRVLQINRNPLGMGDTLTFEGKISSIYEGLEGRWHLPRFPMPQAGFTLAGGLEQRENEAFINRARFLRPSVEYKLRGPWSFFLGYNMERNTMVDLKAQVPDPGYEQQEFFISSLPAGLKYDSRDSLLDPKKGTYFRAEAETAFSAIGSELDFVRPVAEISHILPLTWRDRWYLAGRAKGGACFPGPNLDRVPLVRRFFPGGADSVRGYPYQRLGPLDSAGKPLGGEAFLEGGLEVRFPLYQELGGVVFVDAGNAYEKIDEEVGSLRFTAGAGLRYQTPVGPLRLDFGYQLNPPTDAPISRYAVYLSVGQAF